MLWQLWNVFIEIAGWLGIAYLVVVFITALGLGFCSWAYEDERKEGGK